MNFVPSTELDIPKIAEWSKQDIDSTHWSIDPVWWLTGQGLLSYRIEDSDGITMYVRTESENSTMRVHIQFGPELEVSKSRVIKSILWAFPKMEHVGKMFDLTGFIFKSTSPLLIGFMVKEFGFTSIGDDDYIMPFDRSI